MRFNLDRVLRRSAALAAAVAALLTPAAPARAQEFFEAPREFVVERVCEATRSIRSKMDPVALEPGKTYVARGVNRKTDPTHAFIRVGDQGKWVELGCGRFVDGSSVVASGPTAPGTTPAAGASPAAGQRDPQSCPAFFDDEDNPVSGLGFGGRADITPKKPVLDAFDKSILMVCGHPGRVVPEDEFRRMMLAHPEVLARLRTFTSGKVFANRPARTDNESYLADLTEAWFAVKAFDHIFCGEPAIGGGKIGGLHFHGRYLQLQEAGHACRMTNFRQNEVVPSVIYTMGVRMRNARGEWVMDARKGYGLTLSGEDLMRLITRAFAENPEAGTESQGCLLPVKDDGVAFTAVFVRRSSGIRTFYPDATPNARGTTQNPPCLRAIALQ